MNTIFLSHYFTKNTLIATYDMLQRNLQPAVRSYIRNTRSNLHGAIVKYRYGDYIVVGACI